MATSSSLLRLFLFLSAFQLFSLSGFSQTIPSAQAKENVGQEKTVTGTLMKISPVGKLTILDIDGVFPNAPFSAVIFADKLPLFDQALLESYKTKSVAITGKIVLHKDRPQIILNAPTQIALSGAAPTPLPEPSKTLTPESAQPAGTETAAATPSSTPAPENKPAAPPAAGNLITNGNLNKGKKEWDLPADAEVIADGDSQVIKVTLKAGESVVVKQEIKKLPKDAKQLQASFTAKLAEGSKLNESLSLHLGADIKGGSHFSPKLTPATGSWQDVKWTNIKIPQEESITFFIEIPPGEGTLLLDNFHLSP